MPITQKGKILHTANPDIFKKYLNSRISLKEYATRLKRGTQTHNAALKFEEDAEWVNVIKQIANDSVWEKQGLGFFHRKVPEGINLIRKDKFDLAKLARFGKNKSGDANSKLGIRSRMTKEFYELIEALNSNDLLNKQNKNTTRSNLLIAFCEKWNLQKYVEPDHTASFKIK